MRKKVLEYIIKNNLIQENSIIAVAVSGGVDSMVLLNLILDLKNELKYKQLYCINVDHNIRKSSAEDSLFVADFCKKNNIQCILKKVDVLPFADLEKMTIEESARFLRYQAIEEEIENRQIDCVCLAHHIDDQAETILMHILRGSGLKGAMGMSPKSGFYIRPLLCVKRSEVEEFAEKNKIDFVEDETNKDINFTRNSVRHLIFPVLEKNFKNAKENLCKFGKFASMDEDFINTTLQDEYIKAYDKEIVLSDEVTNLHPSQLSRMLRKCFILLGIDKDIEERHIEIVKELFKKSVGKFVDMPFGVNVLKDYGCLIFTKDADIEEFEPKRFSLGKQTFGNYGTITINLKSKENLDFKKPNTFYADRSKVKGSLVWRTIDSKDKFKKFGGGTKRLSDYLVDKKISSKQRKNLPILASENNILFIAGVEISDDIKIDNNTTEVLEFIVCKNRLDLKI